MGPLHLRDGEENKTSGCLPWQRALLSLKRFPRAILHQRHAKNSYYLPTCLPTWLIYSPTSPPPGWTTQGKVTSRSYRYRQREPSFGMGVLIIATHHSS